jgi:hypothetical protein
MSAEAILRLQARIVSDYYNGGHTTHFINDLNDMAAVADYAGDQAAEAAASSAAASASYALSLGFSLAAYGIGTQPLHLPRAGSLGALAFMGQEALRVLPNTQNATYQITPHDFGKMLLTTSGTNTWTLPLAADLPEGWWCLYRNRSGNNLTINRSGADTFNAAATTLAISTGAAIGMIVRTGATTFEVA